MRPDKDGWWFCLVSFRAIDDPMVVEVIDGRVSFDAEEIKKGFF